MAIKKHQTQGNYTAVSNSIVKDKTLSLTERGLILTLLSFPDDWTLTVKGLCSILPDGKDRITRALNRLIEKGYVTRIQHRSNDGKFAEILLEVNSSPYKDPKAETTPEQDFPYTEYSVANKSDADNRTQYYKQESNTERLMKYTSTKAEDVDNKSNKNNSESYEQIKELLEPYGLSQRDIQTLYHQAKGNIDTIKHATAVLDTQSGQIKSVTGWLLAAINRGYTTPVPRKPLKPNGIRFQLERERDYDDLERRFVKNYRQTAS